MINSQIILSQSDIKSCELASNILPAERINRATQGIFRSVKWEGRIAVFCGGAEIAEYGYMLTQLLSKSNYSVTLFEFEPSYSQFEEPISRKQFAEFSGGDEFSIIVDCILGANLDTKMTLQCQELIMKINKAHALGTFIVSIDLNSGLGVDTGITDLAVISNLTLALGCYKRGHFINSAKDFVGEVRLIDNGVDYANTHAGYACLLVNHSMISSLFPKRKNFTNKSSYGKVALIGGSINYPGAIKLVNAGLSSLFAGAGISTIVAPKSLKDALLPHILQSTFMPAPDKCGYIKFSTRLLDSIIESYDVIAIGPGLGRSSDIVNIMTYLLNHFNGTLIIDADGINNLIGHVELINHSNATIILTPHPREFARITDNDLNYILNNPVESVQHFVENTNATLLLKGSSTLVSSSKESYAYLVNKGCPGMAVGGSGDVLCGLIAGLCALKTAPPVLSASAGAYIAGCAGMMAANEINEYSMLPTDTVAFIPRIISEIIACL
ncbi:MAG: NAD(P)H-hydrate dehydratase [Christensenellaceae bacterium]|jgi:NAD(P)H-hydrate epimerase|nr:NAD(P)H-hydrate dehydratase [Christensenellaceae bacterium]